jgi:hypothetical protein
MKGDLHNVHVTILRSLLIPHHSIGHHVEIIAPKLSHESSTDQSTDDRPAWEPPLLYSLPSACTSGH